MSTDLTEKVKHAARQLLWATSPALFDRVVDQHRGQVFSIGILTGRSPLRLFDAPVPNPVLTSSDVADLPAAFVADPFLIRHGGGWHMFFEAMSRVDRRGCICVASSRDGYRWAYDRVVLREPFHLAYPHVFEFAGEHFMIPDSPGYGVRLYKGVAFPHQWRLVCQLIDHPYMFDNTPFAFDGYWWMYSACSRSRHASKVLCLFVADSPFGPWREHPRSPVAGDDPRVCRPAGRVQLIDGRPIRFAQDGSPSYGTSVRAVEVLELTPETYEERVIESPLLSAGKDAWNIGGMHHVDAWQLGQDVWLAAVDGWHWRHPAN